MCSFDLVLHGFLLLPVLMLLWKMRFEDENSKQTICFNDDGRLTWFVTLQKSLITLYKALLNWSQYET